LKIRCFGCEVDITPHEQVSEPDPDVVASRFYEAVSLHRLQGRDLVPGEREQSIEFSLSLSRSKS
jgi:hypothetical protein